MKKFFKDIFQYHLVVNQDLTNQLAANGERISPRCTSLLSHLLNAHQIWNARILKKTPLGVNDVHSLRDCMLLNEENHEQTLYILDTYNLKTLITYTNSKNVNFNNSIREILFHIINHATHHRGQIIAELRTNGIEPLITDYIFYKR